MNPFIGSSSFVSFLRILEHQGKRIPFFLLELGRLFNPLQGLFNILVYSRPHVSSLRSNHPEYSWLKAFWLTVRTGGDHDSSQAASTNSNKGSSQKVSDRIERNHISSRMNKLRKERKSTNGFALDDGDSAAEPVVEDCDPCLGTTSRQPVEMGSGGVITY